MRGILLFVFSSVLASAADVTGTWHLVLVRFGEESADARVELKVEGGKLTGTLNELKLAENTLVVFTSDNGPWLTKSLNGGSAGLLPIIGERHSVLPFFLLEGGKYPQHFGH